MKIERVWAMPSRWTFQIKPIATLLKQEINNGGLWLDPYAGQYSPAQIKNDLQPNSNAQFHKDALDFLKEQNGEGKQYDGVLYDPPYSLRQLKECYDSVGIKPDPAIFRRDYITQQRNEISRIIKPGGKAICFGWNSTGIGKSRGFKLERILLVPHGGARNDTIVTVERKMNGSLFL